MGNEGGDAGGRAGVSEDPGGGWRVEGSGSPAPPTERPVPPGCNPLLFGVVMATVQMGVLLWLLYGR